MGTTVNVSLIRLHPYWTELDDDHVLVQSVGLFRDRVVCRSCGLILVARYDDMTVPHEDHEHVIHGAYLPPDDVPDHPWVAFHPEDLTQCQDDTTQHLATESDETTPKPRPAGVSAAAAAKGRTRDTPSRSPEARHAEYVRAKRRAARSIVRD